MIEKKWKYRSSNSTSSAADNISRKLNIPPVIASILLNRGINENDIPSFLSKSMKNVHNPLLFNDMKKAVNRILQAVENKEKITIYGDYDVDGITSTTLMLDFLTSIGADASFYIPDRRDEGYGINIKAVNRFIKQGIKLMISVDCGITALGEISFAKLLGMDVIVTDHHTCKERLPEDACAIINPKTPGSEYPFDGLAGVGVAFKLVLALAMALKMNTTQCFMKYADIAAIGTIADVVPLTDENRIIVDRGIKAMRSSMRPGVAALFKAAGAQLNTLSADSIAFTLAPRLNAAGRLGAAATGVELLMASDTEEAAKIAEKLDCENTERRLTEQKIYDEALSLIAEDINFEKKKVIVLAKKGWHQGVIGIVASRICELFYKPCILISLDENGEGKGSGRSIPSFDLFDALSQCEDKLNEFGGHSAAAGLGIDEADIEEFSRRINKYADGRLSVSNMIPELGIDCRVSAKDVSVESAKLLETLEPFGMGNEKPIFSLSDSRIAAISRVGIDGRHLRLKLQNDGKYINCIGFNFGDLCDTMHEGDSADVAFYMETNNYQGYENVQLNIKDIKRR